MNPNPGIAEEIREDGTSNCLVCGYNINVDVAIHNTGRTDCCDNCAIDRREEYLRKALSKAEDRLRTLLEERNYYKLLTDANKQDEAAFKTLQNEVERLQQKNERITKERDEWIRQYQRIERTSTSVIEVQTRELQQLREELEQERYNHEMTKEELFYEKRASAENHEKFVSAYNQLAEKDKVLKYADNEIESAFNMLREDSFENAEDAGETLGKVHLLIRSILSQYKGANTSETTT